MLPAIDADTRVVAHSARPAKRKVEAISTTPWEMVLNAEERDDASRDYGIVDEQQVQF